MRSIFYFLLPLSLFSHSMLSDAILVEKEYAFATAKFPPPSPAAQTDALLSSAPVWFSVDLNSLAVKEGGSALEILSGEAFWDILGEIGVKGLYIEGLKTGGAFQTDFSIDPKWGPSQWPKITMEAQRRGIVLIGDSIGYSTGLGSDFKKALQNEGDYPSLYHLIEINQAHWGLLPSSSFGKMAANIPWLTLQKLDGLGYVSEKSRPYVKQSDWNATGVIKGVDGVLRRWIYLKKNQNDPVLSWLSPSFSANRLASGDALNMIYRLEQKIHCLDAELPNIAKEIQSLMIRKIGGLSVQKNSQTLKEVKENNCDASMDTWTRAALLHALISEETQVLRLIYRLFLAEGISIKSLVHVLQPFDPFARDWTEFSMNPKKVYPYFDEQITGELLRLKLIKEDLFRLNAPREEILPSSTWTGYCSLTPSAMKIQDFEKKGKEIQKAHELLAFAYAMQPGVFSFSAADILGALPEQAKNLDLMGPNTKTLYPALELQLRNPHSFASRLKKILSIRQSSNIAQGELIAVPQVANQSTLLLLHRLPKNQCIQLLALNFGREKVEEKIELKEIQHTMAIELISSLVQPKVFDSGTFTFDLAPLSGKVFLFQPKYFD